MLFPPSKTNHMAVNHTYLAYYPPIIALFISVSGYLVKMYIDGNYFDFGVGMVVFPFVLSSFVVWLHLILDFMLCIINKYGKDSLLDLSETLVRNTNNTNNTNTNNTNTNPNSSYSPIGIPKKKNKESSNTQTTSLL